MNDTSIRSSMYEKLPITQAATLTLFSLICLLFGIKGNGNAIAILTFAISMVLSVRYNALALGTIIVAAPFLGVLTTGFLQIVVYIPFLLSSFMRLVAKGSNKSVTILFFWSLLLTFISYISGFEPDTVTFLIQVFSMSMFYVVLETFNRKHIPIVVWSYIVSAIVIIIYMLSGGLNAVTATGRLALGEHVKTVAFICAVPFVFLLHPFISRIFMFSNLKSFLWKIIDIIFLIILMLTIFMTLARGLMLAIAIGALLLMLLLKKRKTFFLLAIVTIVAVYVFTYVESLELFRTERLLAYEEYKSGNGRTEIWSHYIDKMINMGSQYILLGVGPGNIERISNIGFYAHSTIIDYFYSYGILGFLTFIYIEASVFAKLFKNKNKIPFTICLTFLLAYATHGVAANLTLFLIQALMLVNTKCIPAMRKKISSRILI